MNGTKYIYLRDGKTGNWSIFDLDKRNELHEIAYMQRDPWFVDATRIGKTIIWID
jgi:muconolactone delta-isomerase